jgi:hypothetical protein
MFFPSMYHFIFYKNACLSLNVCASSIPLHSLFSSNPCLFSKKKKLCKSSIMIMTNEISRKSCTHCANWVLLELTLEFSFWLPIHLRSFICFSFQFYPSIPILDPLFKYLRNLEGMAGCLKK